MKLPHAQVRDFLPENQHAALLDYVLANPERFRPATIRSGNDSVVNTDRRVASVCRDLGPSAVDLQEHFLDALPMLMEQTGLRGPPPSLLEVELAAHGDGAFYHAHTDIAVGETRKRRTDKTDRILSAVYYFHAEPKGFSGGELRLFRLGPDAGYVDIEPLQNSLVVFHSWVPHEVRPVAVPSGAFRDYRFAINCWYRRNLPDRTGGAGQADGRDAAP